MFRQLLPASLVSLAVLAGLNGAIGEQPAHANPGTLSQDAVRAARQTSKRAHHASKRRPGCGQHNKQPHRRPRPCTKPHITRVRRNPASTNTRVPAQTPVADSQGSIAPTTTEPPDTTATEPTVASITAWKAQAAPVAWAGGRIYYNQRSASGLFDGWSANPDGSGAICVTCNGLYPSGTQHGISDASPDGQYLLTTIERASHPPLAVGGEASAPGKGAFNDLWLQTSNGSHAWQLTNEQTSGTTALIWPRFDSSGTRVIWSEQWQWGAPFGGWQLHVAQITWSGGVPSLTNEKTLRSTGLLEPYGFTPDGSHVLFAADALAGTSWDDLQIMTMSAELTGPATRLSPEDASDSGWFTNYNEFAFSMPDSERIIFARSVGAYYESLEYWTMNSDGSDPRQLTWLSVPWSDQYLGHPSLASALAFDPTNPKRFVASIETDYHDDYESLMITLN
jgi:hypothetical protein